MHAPAEKPTQVRWLVFSLAGATSWLLYLHRYSWGLVKPDFAREHPGLTSRDLGVIDSAFMIAYAIGQVPLGILGDRFGPRVILAVLICLWSLALAAIGLVQTYTALFHVMAWFGLVQAGAYPLISKVTRNWFPSQYRTTVQAMVTSLGRVGAACAPIIVATILLGNVHLTWQQSLGVIAVPGIGLGLAVLVLLRNNPREHPWANDSERILLTPPGESPGTAVEPLRLDTSPATLISFGMMLFYAFASTFADMLYVYWIPTFLRDGKGLTPEQMGLVAPLPLIGGAIGGLLGGTLNDLLIRTLGNRRWGRSLVAITGKTLAAAFIALSVSIDNPYAVMVALFACKFFGDWSLPTQWGALTDMAGRSAATVFGIVNTVGAVGGMLAPPLMGQLRDHYGWDTVFYSLASVYLCAALAWLFINCTRPLVR